MTNVRWVPRGITVVIGVLLLAAPAIAPRAAAALIEPSSGFLVDLFVNAGDTLLIRAGVEVTFTGTAQNFGTIVNLGRITNRAALHNNNGGRIENSGSIDNERGDEPRGIVINHAGGVIHNTRTGSIESNFPSSPDLPAGLRNEAGATFDNSGNLRLVTDTTFSALSEMLANSGTFTNFETGSVHQQSGIFNNRGGIVTNLGIWELSTDNSDALPTLRNSDLARIRNRGIVRRLSPANSSTIHVVNAAFDNYGGIVKASISTGASAVVRNWGNGPDFVGLGLLTCGDALPRVSTALDTCEDVDLDGDGILDAVDADLTSFSDVFSDVVLGPSAFVDQDGPPGSDLQPSVIAGTGRTTGRVVLRAARPGGTQIFPVISEEPNPGRGVRIGAVEKPAVVGLSFAGGAFEIEAAVSVCSDASLIRVAPGDAVMVTCGGPSGLTLAVTDGQIGAEFKRGESTMGTSSLTAGDRVSFDPAMSRVTNYGGKPVQVTGSSAGPVTVDPGEAVTLQSGR